MGEALHHWTAIRNTAYSAEPAGHELEFLFNIYIKNNERFTGLSLVRTSEVCIKVLYNI